MSLPHIRHIVSILITCLIVFPTADAETLTQTVQASIDSCLAQDNPRACVIKVNDSCGHSPKVTSEASYGRCIDIELKLWDKKLNAIYKQLIPALKLRDKKLASNVQRTADALRGAQRAWIPFRDNKCDFEGEHLATQNISEGIATTECLARETAYQYLYLLKYSKIP